MIKILTQIKFVKDSFWTICSLVFVSVSGLIINSIIGIRYNAEGLGIFNQSLSIYLLLTLLSNFGIQTSAQKHASQYSNEPKKLRQIFSNSVVLTGLISIVFTLVIVLILNVFPRILSSMDVFHFVKILCFALPFFSLNKTINNYLAGLRLFKVYSGVRILRWLFILSGIIFISSINASLNTVAFLFIFTETVLFFLLMMRCKSYWTKPGLEWIRIHLKFGLKNIMAEFVSTFNTHMPILVIGYVSGDAASGYFAYILFFARSVLMIPGALQKNFNPIFTKLWYSNSVEEVKEKIFKVFRVCFISLIPVFLLFYLFFFTYTYLFMPSEYLDLSILLMILFLGVGTTYLFGPFSTLLIMSGDLYTNLLRVSIITITNFILTLVLVWQFDYTGAAYAITTSLFLEMFLLDVFYRRKLGIKLFKITFFQIAGNYYNKS